MLRQLSTFDLKVKFVLTISPTELATHPSNCIRCLNNSFYNSLEFPGILKKEKNTLKILRKKISNKSSLRKKITSSGLEIKKIFENIPQIFQAFKFRVLDYHIVLEFVLELIEAAKSINAGKVGHAWKIIRLNNLGVGWVYDKSTWPLKVKVRPLRKSFSK